MDVATKYQRGYNIESRSYAGREVMKFFFHLVWGRCNIPDYFHGDWYSRESGKDIRTLVNADKWDSNEDDSELNCEDIFIHSNPGLQQDGNNVTMLMVKR